MQQLIFTLLVAATATTMRGPSAALACSFRGFRQRQHIRLDAEMLEGEIAAEPPEEAVRFAVRGKRGQ